MSTFSVSINDGPVQSVDVPTGVYNYVAAALPAILDIEPPFEAVIATQFSAFRYKVQNAKPYWGHICTHQLFPIAYWWCGYCGDRVPFMDTVRWP